MIRKVRYVLRPDGIMTSPKLLAKDFTGSEDNTRKWPGWTSARPNYEEDLFLVYPKSEAVDTKNPKVYQELRDFFSCSKYGQRQQMMKAGLPIPMTHRTNNQSAAFKKIGKYVVRPFWHAGGEDYRITNDSHDFVEGEEYISECIPKEREYRLLYCYGKLVGVWNKQKGEKVGQDDAWGNLHCWYLRVEDLEDCYLYNNTNAVEDLEKHPIIKNAHLVGVDVLYYQKKYVILEYNVCPIMNTAWARRQVHKQLNIVRKDLNIK